MAGETLLVGDVQIVSLYNATAYEPIGCLSNNSFDSELAVNELSTKCDAGNVIKTPGAFSYSISGDGFSIDSAVDTGKLSYEDLFDLQQAKTLVEWKLDTATTTNTAVYGSGYITSLSQASPTASENSTFTFTISGSGATTYTNPNP